MICEDKHLQMNVEGYLNYKQGTEACKSIKRGKKQTTVALEYILKMHNIFKAMLPTDSD